MHKWLLILRSDDTQLASQWACKAKCKQWSAALVGTWGFWCPPSHSEWTPKYLQTEFGHVRTGTRNKYHKRHSPAPTRQNIELNFMYLTFIKSINTPRAAPLLSSLFNTDRLCIWQPGFAPCSQAVCSIHLAALTIATERKKTCLPSPPLISSEKKELSPLPPSHPSLSFNKWSCNLWSVSLSSLFSSPAHSQSE